MNFRGTYVMLAIVGLSLAGLTGYVLYKGNKPATGSGFVLESLQAAGLKATDITAVDIEINSTPPLTLSFVRDSKELPWRLTKPIETRVNSREVDDVVRDLLEAKNISDFRDLTRNLKQHGLEKPGAVITLRKGGERSASLSIGDVTLGEQSAVVFVLSSDKPKEPQVVRKSALKALFKATPGEDAKDTPDFLKGVSDFRPRELLREGIFDAITQTDLIRLTKGKTVLALRKNFQKGWIFEEPKGFGSAEVDGGSAAGGADDINSVKRLLEKAYDIQVATSADYIDSLEDLPKYGLDPKDPNIFKLEITRSDAAGGTVVLWIGKEVGEKFDKTYVRVEGDSCIAKVNSAPIRALKKILDNPGALRDRTFAQLQLAKLDAIDIDIKGTKFELRRTSETPPGWNLYDPSGGSAVASPSTVEALLSALNKPRQIIDFPAPGKTDAELGFDKTPEVEIKLWYDGIAKPAAGGKIDPATKPKVRETADVTILFGKPEVAARYARRIEGGSKFDALVPEELFTIASKPRLAYLDPALKSFSTENVTKLSFNRGAEIFTLEKGIKDTVWKITAPESRKGRTADPTKVATILGNLSGLRASKVVADNADAAQLARIKLDPKDPRIKVSLTLSNDKNEKVYYFGDEITPDKVNVYAKLADSSLVIEVPRSVVDSLVSGELQDLVVYRLDKEKIKRVKLRGWADIVGSVAVREVVLKEGKWVFKEPTGYDIDPVQVENFLNDIITPRAEQIIPAKTLDAKYGLDVNKSAVEVEIEEDGGKITNLTLGAETDGGKLIYAQTNKLPGDVFTLLRDRFKTVSKPKVFAK